MIEHDLDYVRIAKAIRYLDENATAQPSLDALADHVGLSKYHVHRLFKQWAGLTNGPQNVRATTEIGESPEAAPTRE